MPSARFSCAVCGAEAGTVDLVDEGDGAHLRRTSFTSVLIEPLTPDGRVAVACSIADAAALHALDEEYAPFWCPACAASYCGVHWETWDVFDGDWHDSIRGRCPHGHERRLED